jgi:hypothetical protein
MVFENDRKIVYMLNYATHMEERKIVYPGRQEAEVTDVATSNGYLYILRGAVKTIDVYRLSDCMRYQ